MGLAKLLAQKQQQTRKDGAQAMLMALALALLSGPSSPAHALEQQRKAPQGNQAPPRAEPPESYESLSPWARMKIAPRDALPALPERRRTTPPEDGRRTCIRIDGIAGAQLFGDTSIELTMRNGQHWRMFLAAECPGLSFYQGFYYRRGKAGRLCAGRDSIGARSGGECPIASIVPMAAAQR